VEHLPSLDYYQPFPNGTWVIHSKTTLELMLPLTKGRLHAEVWYMYGNKGHSFRFGPAPYKLAIYQCHKSKFGEMCPSKISDKAEVHIAYLSMT
jgi:hypothetical protein